MAALSKTLRYLEGGLVAFWCPGCDGCHAVPVVATPGWNGPWGFNWNTEKPTLTPSLLVKHRQWTPPVTADNLEQWQRLPWEQHIVEHVCHSFVTDGRIQFLSDCTHALAGQTVDLPDWDAETGSF